MKNFVRAISTGTVICLITGVAGFVAVPATAQSTSSDRQQTATYPAECSLTSADDKIAVPSVMGGFIGGGIFYVHINLKTHGWKFRGDGGGLFNIGIGYLTGTIITSDWSRLTRDTVSFQVVATPVYVTVTFLDRNSNSLGHLHSAAVSSMTGVGGGRGSWF